MPQAARRASFRAPQAPTATALDIALLVMDREPHNAERAALRWLGRWTLESREATLAGLLEATVAMSTVAHEPERWETVLRRLAGS